MSNQQGFDTLNNKMKPAADVSVASALLHEVNLGYVLGATGTIYSATNKDCHAEQRGVNGELNGLVCTPLHWGTQPTSDQIQSKALTAAFDKYFKEF